MKVIHLFPHTLNLGDYFVKIGIRKLLDEFFVQIEYTDLPASSKAFKQSDSAILGGITLDTVNFLNQHDLIVIGGSNLYETIKSDQLEISIDALQQVEKPILLLGIGSGWSSISPQFPQISEAVREKLLLLHQKSLGSSVRDHFTQRLLLSYQIGKPEVTGCPAAYIFEKALKPVKNRTVYVTGLPNRLYVEQMLNPITARWRYSYQRRRHVTVGYMKLLKMLKHEGVNFKIYITDSRDIPVAEKILGGSKNIVFNDTPEILLSYLDECDLMIGYRLHACIPSLSKGIPVIPLPLDGRVLGFIETYGLTEYSVNVYDPSPESMILERVKLALEGNRSAWDVTITKRDEMGRVMRSFLDKSLSKI